MLNLAQTATEWRQYPSYAPKPELYTPIGPSYTENPIPLN